MLPREQVMILLCGKSGSGKDYIADALDLRLVVSRTNRERRLGEIAGVHKKFISKPKRFRGAFDWYLFIKEDEKTIAHTLRENKYIYWTEKGDLIGKNAYIIDKPGIEELLKNTELCDLFNFKVVYVKCGLLKRIRNMRKRKESWRNVFSRIIEDRKSFKGIKDIADYVIEK
jgi:guanylate kinase